jgi:hypothetical protein
MSFAAFLDNDGHQVIEGSEEIWAEHGLEAVQNMPLNGIQGKNGQPRH